MRKYLNFNFFHKSCNPCNFLWKHHYFVRYGRLVIKFILDIAVPVVVMILVEFGKHWQYQKQIQIKFWWWDEQACLVHYAGENIRSENVPQVNAKPPADAGLLGDIINLVFRYFSLGFQKYFSLGFNKYLWSNIFWFAFRGDPYEGVSSDTSLKRDYRSVSSFIFHKSSFVLFFSF